MKVSLRQRYYTYLPRNDKGRYVDNKANRRLGGVGDAIKRKVLTRVGTNGKVLDITF